MPTMTMTQKVYRELEQAAQMSGATKDACFGKCLESLSWRIEGRRRKCQACRKSVIQSRIKKYMKEIATLDDPCSRGKALTSNLADLWRCHVGDYRILCRIHDDKLIITVIELAQHSTIYR